MYEDKTGWNGRCGCDMPERPLSYGAYICSKPGCRISVLATARKYPNLKLVIKFGGPRQVISAQDYLVATEADTLEERISNLLDFSVNGQADYIREIFVMEGTGCLDM
jgi:hypothetical protein